MSCYIESDGKESLFTSIPYTKGWDVYRNGEKVQINKIENCLITIPLTEGDNEIVMKYHIPFLGVGIIVSMIFFDANGRKYKNYKGLKLMEV